MQTPQTYVYGTEPYAHQRTGFELSADLEAFALSCEQGTGKTKMLTDTAAYLYSKGLIEAVLVLAPNGVHRNWIRKELPKHMPPYVKWAGAAWSTSQTKKTLAEWDHVVQGKVGLRVLTFNVESLIVPRALKEMKLILDAYRTLLILDESHLCKNPKAKRTENLLKLSTRAKYRRIATGTPVTAGPLDVFSQYLFLDEEILGTTSFTVFRARYAEMLSESDPFVKELKRKHGLKYSPPIQRVDEFGKPIFKNLDDLQKRIAPFTYRVLKSDCLDLPDKIYTTRSFEIAPEQRHWYDEIVRRVKHGIGLDAGIAHKPMSKIAAFTYVQQVTSGILPAVLSPTGETVSIFDDPLKNPRVQIMLEQIEGTDEAFLIWCRYTLDILSVAAVLSDRYGADKVATLYGETSPADRDAAEDGIQSGRLRFLVANQEAAGIGRTMTAATQTLYYSNSFKLGPRLQSEDRNHRIGSVNRVLYTDLIAENTIDERIVTALVNKKDVADIINGDEGTKWLKTL